MGVPAPTELLLILAIVVFIFGTKRIPEIMGGIGEGIKTFKKSLETDESTGPPTSSPSTDQNAAKPENNKIAPK
ncbi:MAG: twin-arginine translocase TatA/TatE family subunit [Desulfomonilaceae bacterium]